METLITDTSKILFIYTSYKMQLLLISSIVIHLQYLRLLLKCENPLEYPTVLTQLHGCAITANEEVHSNHKSNKSAKK